MKFILLLFVAAIIHGASSLRFATRDDSSINVSAEDPTGSNGAEESTTITSADVENDDGGSATCKECLKDPGICCALECQSGMCPKVAIEKGGWTINGVKITGGQKRR